MKQGSGKNGAHPARPKMVSAQGGRDPFWRKDEAKPVVAEEATEGVTSLSTPEEIADWIAKRAYELYEARGKADGQDQDDWYKAEQEVSEFLKRMSAEDEGKDSGSTP